MVFCKSKMALAAALALGLGGCGGGSSSSDSGGESGGNSVNGRAADGYLVNARVCADLNNSRTCDAGEPTTTTGEGGKWALDVEEGTSTSIVVEAIANLTVDEDTGLPIDRGYTLESPLDWSKESQFVSPLTTMVSAELKSGRSSTLDDAKAAVAAKLGSTGDVTEDYIAYVKNPQSAPNGVDGQRLHRIAQVLATATARMEGATDQSTLEQAGLSKADLGSLITNEINRLLPAILAKVSETVNSGTFDPDAVLDDPSVALNEAEVIAVVTDPDRAQVLHRFVDAERSRAPYFDDEGYPIVGAGIYEPEFVSVNAGTISYKAIVRTMTPETGSCYCQSDYDTALTETTTQILIENAGNLEESTVSDDTDVVRFFDSGEVREANVLRYDLGDRLVDGSFTQESVTAYFTEPTPGYPQPGIFGQTTYFRVDLSNLDVESAVRHMYPDALPEEPAGEMFERRFPDNAFAYQRTETSDDSLHIFAPGPQNQVPVNDNDSASNPTASTLDRILTPPPEDGYVEPARLSPQLHAVTPDGTEATVNLVGSLRDGEGFVQIHEYAEDEQGGRYRGELLAESTWKFRTSPVDHIEVDLPDGFDGRAPALPHKKGNTIFLVNDGKVRQGLFVFGGNPRGTNTDALFGRETGGWLLNGTAKDFTLNTMDRWGILEAYPPEAGD